MPSYLYESARMCNGFQIVKHRGSDRITVQGWSWINPKIGNDETSDCCDEEDEFFDTSQDLPDQDGDLQDELRHLSQLVDSIHLDSQGAAGRAARSPSPSDIVSHQLNELLALDAEVGSIIGRAEAHAEDRGGDGDMSALRSKMVRNRERLRQIRATARTGKDSAAAAAAAAEPRRAQALERSPSMAVRQDMRRLRQQLHELRSLSPPGDGDSGRSRSPAASMTSSVPSSGHDDQDLGGLAEPRCAARRRPPRPLAHSYQHLARARAAQTYIAVSVDCATLDKRENGAGGSRSVCRCAGRLCACAHSAGPQATLPEAGPDGPGPGPPGHDLSALQAPALQVVPRDRAQRETLFRRRPVGRQPPPRVFESEEERVRERDRIVAELSALKDQLERIRARRTAAAASFKGAAPRDSDSSLPLAATAAAASPGGARTPLPPPSPLSPPAAAAGRIANGGARGDDEATAAAAAGGVGSLRRESSRARRAEALLPDVPPAPGPPGPLPPLIGGRLCTAGPSAAASPWADDSDGRRPVSASESEGSDGTASMAPPPRRAGRAGPRAAAPLAAEVQDYDC